MAEIELTEEQQQQFEQLTNALEQDEALRERLQVDAQAVFSEYGLAGIVPAQVQWEINTGELEVVGLAIAQAATHLDKPIHFDKVTHVDSAAAFGGVRVQIVPTTVAQ